MMLAALLVAACLPLGGDGDRITAADLARGAPEFQALPPEIVIGAAPVPGTRRIFAVAELRRLAERYGLPADASAPVCLEHKVAPLDPVRLLAGMQTALQLPDARIEIVEYSRYPAPQGEISFSRADLPSPPAAKTQAAVLWKGVVRYGAGRPFAIWARVRVLVSVECIVAAQPLIAGHAIEPAQLRRAVYEGFPVAGKPAQTIEQAAGRVPRRAIAAGSPILPDALDAPYDVVRGETVEVEVSSGDAHLKLDARAEADGRQGQIIPVLNPANGRRFSARVSSPGKVVVRP